MRTSNLHWAVMAGCNLLLLALVVMVNDGLTGWSVALFLAGPCVVVPALQLPPGQLLACLALSGLALDVQLATPFGFLMSLFVLGAMLVLAIRPWLGYVTRTQQIGLAWLLNALYFGAFTMWALAQHGPSAALWELVAVNFGLSQILLLPVALWFFDFQDNVLARAGLTAPPHRAGDAF